MRSLTKLQNFLNFTSKSAHPMTYGLVLNFTTTVFTVLCCVVSLAGIFIVFAVNSSYSPFFIVFAINVVFTKSIWHLRENSSLCLNGLNLPVYVI